MKKVRILFACMMLCFTLGGCGLFNEKNISQKEAQKIAEGVTGGEVTYVRTETLSQTAILYVFTDSKGIEFAIKSSLNKQSIDGSKPFGPYHCVVWDTYQTCVQLSNQEAIEEILDKYGLLENMHVYPRTMEDALPGGIELSFYLGTPEENKLLLDKVAAAGAEIDALLDMHYNANYGEEMGNKYYEYSNSSYELSSYRLCYLVEFIKKTEGGDISEICYDIGKVPFSLADEDRWTAESMYEALCESLEKVEVAE